LGQCEAAGGKRGKGRSGVPTFGRDAGTGEDDQTLASGDELGGLSQACLGDASALKGGGGGLHASALLAALHFCVVREEEKT